MSLSNNDLTRLVGVLQPVIARMVQEQGGNRAAPLWRPATIDDDVPPGGTVDVVMPGDVPVPARNVTGHSLGEGARVWVQLTPPHGVEIVGHIAGDSSIEYIPELTAVTTAPNLGTGAMQVGRYTQVGDLVVGHFSIQAGTGTSAGSGTYQFSLPVLPRAPGDDVDIPIGVGRTQNGQNRVAIPFVTAADAALGICRLSHPEHVSGPLRYVSAVSSTTSAVADGMRYLVSFSYLADLVGAAET